MINCLSVVHKVKIPLVVLDSCTNLSPIIQRNVERLKVSIHNLSYFLLLVVSPNLLILQLELWMVGIEGLVLIDEPSYK